MSPIKPWIHYTKPSVSRNGSLRSYLFNSQCHFAVDTVEQGPIRPDGCDPEVEYDIHGHVENHQGADCRVRLMDRAGADPREWPECLQVREFPQGKRLDPCSEVVRP